MTTCFGARLGYSNEPAEVRKSARCSAIENALARDVELVERVEGEDARAVKPARRPMRVFEHDDVKAVPAAQQRVQTARPPPTNHDICIR